MRPGTKRCLLSVYSEGLGLGKYRAWFRLFRPHPMVQEPAREVSWSQLLFADGCYTVWKDLGTLHSLKGTGRVLVSVCSTTEGARGQHFHPMRQACSHAWCVASSLLRKWATRSLPCWGSQLLARAGPEHEDAITFSLMCLWDLN